MERMKAILFAVALAGCAGPVCPAMPCSSTLTVNARFTSAIEPGAYQVTISDAEGTRVTCDVDTSASTTATCSEQGATFRVINDTFRITVPSGPRTVHVEVTTDSRVIGSTDDSPSYSPVDEECSPSCETATVDFDVSP